MAGFRRHFVALSSSFIALALFAVPQISHASPVIPLPNIPKGMYNIVDYGAVGDGVTMNTAAIQKAIDAASEAGGGRVLVPEGKFLTGPFKLASRINLHLAKDSMLLLSDDIENYPITKDVTSPISEEASNESIKARQIATSEHYADAITAREAHDIEISGEGTIDGQGDVWWKAFRKDQEERRKRREERRKAGIDAPDEIPPMTHRPHMFKLVRCVRLFVHDVKLKNSPMFHLITEDCTDVNIENVTITAPWDSPNTDGIDFSGWNYLITGCTVDNGDDHIVAKPTTSRQPGNKNITISNCTLLHGRGICIGSTTIGGTEDMLVNYCTFKDSDYAIHIKSGRNRGGLVQRIRFENIKMTNVKLPIFINGYYSGRKSKDLTIEPLLPVTITTPTYRDILIRNVTATDCPTAGRIQCVPEMPIVNLTLENVHIAAREGMRVLYARGMRFIDSSITAEAGDPLQAHDAEISGMEYVPVPPLPVEPPKVENGK